MIEFKLPSLGADMDEGTLLEWKVHPGDVVKPGQVIAVVDTAKAAIDVECWHEGTVSQLLIDIGAKVPVGTAIAWLLEPGENPQSARRHDCGASADRRASPVRQAPADFSSGAQACCRVRAQYR